MRIKCLSALFSIAILTTICAQGIKVTFPNEKGVVIYSGDTVIVEWTASIRSDVRVCYIHDKNTGIHWNNWPLLTYHPPSGINDSKHSVHPNDNTWGKLPWLVPAESEMVGRFSKLKGQNTDCGWIWIRCYEGCDYKDYSDNCFKWIRQKRPGGSIKVHKDMKITNAGSIPKATNRKQFAQLSLMPPFSAKNTIAAHGFADVMITQAGNKNALYSLTGRRAYSRQK